MSFQENSKQLYKELFKVRPSIIKKAIPWIYWLSKYHKHLLVGSDLIPNGRCLLVINHSWATYDVLLLSLALLDQKIKLPRALADHNFFKFAWSSQLMQELGIAEGNPQRAKILLEHDEWLMVAPGGMREALRPSTNEEKYKVDWEKRTGFVKLAIQTQSPICLIGCPAADDIYDVQRTQLTEYIYHRYKLPFVKFSGIAKSWLPKPVQLTHYVHPPIYPPIYSEDNLSQDVEKLHNLLIEEMNCLLKKGPSHHE